LVVGAVNLGRTFPLIDMRVDSSGHVPVALSLFMQERNHFLKCACFCYGYMLDRTGEAVVSEASAKWKFKNPWAGKSVDDLPRHLPVFVARAGQDQMPRLNDTIDWFLADAMIHNLPVSFVNHHNAPHAFDLRRQRRYPSVNSAAARVHARPSSRRFRGACHAHEMRRNSGCGVAGWLRPTPRPECGFTKERGIHGGRSLAQAMFWPTQSPSR